MIVSEYVRGLKNNYIRIRELTLPDERKYQYCIMKRGGITGLLPFEIRYIDSDAYMYYDITSRQNISTLYSKKPLDRIWISSFFSSMKKIRNEAVRFLLDPVNLIWNPSNVYQDLKTGKFGYLYVPYLSDDNGMGELMDFMVEHVDYSDEELVKCVYSIAEQYKNSGEIYLSDKVYYDVAMLNVSDEEKAAAFAIPGQDMISEDKTDPEEVTSLAEKNLDDMYEQAEKIGNAFKHPDERPLRLKPDSENEKSSRGISTMKGGGIKEIISKMIYGNKKYRDEYDFGYSDEPAVNVAEDTIYSDSESEDDNEGTIFVDLSDEEKNHRLLSETGQVVHVIDEESCVIGKKKDEVDLFIDEEAISRIHARIVAKDDEFFIQDLNSKNGTFKNGLRLKPYEEKKLVKGDEIKLATRKFIFS